MPAEAINRLQSQIGVSATPKEMTFVILAAIALILYVTLIRPAFK